MSAQLAAYSTSTGEAFQFWVLGTVAVIGALCTVFMKKTVHSALCLAGTMIVLAVFYPPTAPTSWVSCRSSSTPARS